MQHMGNALRGSCYVSKLWCVGVGVGGDYSLRRLLCVGVSVKEIGVWELQCPGAAIFVSSGVSGGFGV